jgi:hypothetical protein
MITAVDTNILLNILVPNEALYEASVARGVGIGNREAREPGFLPIF